MVLRILILSLILISFAACGNRHDARLDRVAELAPKSPHEALDSLAAINPRDLSAADRHYYDLLTIRASDKAYLSFESDSLILDVIDYYSDHKDDPNLVMAMYYGGRVYHELGDFPTAMKYYRQSLDLIEKYGDKLDLRKSVASQYSSLLLYLRLYDEAIPVLKTSIEIEKERHDSISLMYDLQMLGAAYRNSENYDLAEQTYKESLDYCAGLPSEFKAKTMMGLASVKMETGKIDSAMYLIRGIPDELNEYERPTALAYATRIYAAAGKLDIVREYSQEMLKSSNEVSKLMAYQALLSPQLIDQLPKDSLSVYFWDYRNLLEKFFDSNNTEFALTQQNLYNYKMHERNRAKAERSNAKLYQCIMVALFVILLLIVGILYLKNKNKSNIIELHEALDNIKRLKSELWHTDSGSPSVSFPSTVGLNSQSQKQKENELRERLKTELMELYSNVDPKMAPAESILQSEAYKELKEAINNNKIIDEDDLFWNDLERAILLASPQFTSNLNLLTLGRMTTQEFHTAMLIKCGIKPYQMKVVFGRSNGTIVSRRQSLCQKVLDQNLGTNAIDSIIRSL